MSLIKVKNKRRGGNLFHYAHFICDCLFPEVLANIYEFNRVFRVKNLDQTLGNFEKFHQEIFNCSNIEVNEADFDDISCQEKLIERLPSHENIKDFRIFTDFIFDSLNFNKSPDPSYPEVILIKRGERVELISDPDLRGQNENLTNGKERREIKGIERAERRLSEKYEDKFQSICLEGMSFKDQVSYFYNAKIIVCAHGACMANLFFCQAGTSVIEVNAQTPEDKRMGAGNYPFFDTICRVLNLNQHKIDRNNGFNLLKYIDSL
jgi:hypothetical protein